MLKQVFVRPTVFSGYYKYGTDKPLILRFFQPLIATVTFTGIAVEGCRDAEQELTYLATNDWYQHV